jgi:hypothetical protein
MEPRRFPFMHCARSWWIMHENCSFTQTKIEKGYLALTSSASRRTGPYRMSTRVTDAGTPCTGELRRMVSGSGALVSLFE